MPTMCIYASLGTSYQIMSDTLKNVWVLFVHICQQYVAIIPLCSEPLFHKPTVLNDPIGSSPKDLDLGSVLASVWDQHAQSTCQGKQASVAPSYINHMRRRASRGISSSNVGNISSRKCLQMSSVSLCGSRYGPILYILNVL